jgi:hypothetical protein
MSKHEQYEELCTLAMIGEVSATEMQDLRQHLSECADCREQYREFTQFLLPQLSISSENDTTFETGYSTADNARLRIEFLAHAQKGGVTFSQDAIRGTANTTAQAVSSQLVPHKSREPWYVPRYQWALVASVAMLLFAGGYETHLMLVHRKAAPVQIVVEQPVAPLPISPTADASPVGDKLARLRIADDDDRKTIATLQQKLTDTVAELQAARQTLATYETSQATLQDQLNEKNKQLASLQSQEQGDAQSANDLRSQVAQLQQRISDGQTTLAANEARIRDLSGQLSTQTASLGREQEMLSVGRDVRDLMGARNLHIIDVRDSNGTGKDRASFGRVFYTEGKSLIFYAFDLDDKKVVNANYSFEAWGERLGQPSSVKSLGVLYVDDKSQRRWSLKVDDPHQLSEINSVFVTLEPRKGDGDKPHGQRILYAYLGGEPNHP